MKILSTISLIILIELICSTQTTLSDNCIDVSPFNRLETRMVHCPLVSRKDKRASTSSDNIFDIDLSECSAGKELCNKVKNVFTSAGRFITATLNLKSRINVKARFINDCKSLQSCNNTDNTVTVVGSANPARFIPYKDPTDSKVRYYPQALYKQLNLPGEHPLFGPADISATFNSNVNYWFEGDPLPMLDTQIDMLYVVLHELIHGLGFTNSWQDHFNLQALTPMPKIQSQSIQGGFAVKSAERSFNEFIFDKYLVLLPSGKPLTSVTDQLNQFQLASISEFVNTFKASPQFSIAQDMYKQATTRHAIGFLTTPNLQLNTQLTPDQIQNNFVILETNLITFNPGSSIGHVDNETYFNSSDFLMMAKYPKSVTLNEMMYNAGSTTTTGPIGPKLRLVLEMLGYDVKKDYTPPSIENNSSLISFNLLLSLGCALLTLIYNI